MELGATICLPKSPLCLQCPVVEYCRTRGEHVTEPRAKQKSGIVAHLLAVRKFGTETEVLLERRSTEASLMPGMLELPPLPLTAVEGREPVLRVRHAITNTNYYAQIFSEGAAGAALAGESHETADRDMGEEQFSDSSPGENGVEDEDIFEDELFVATEGESKLFEGESSRSLLGEIPAAAGDLHWTPTRRLRELPLTGLARKVLQRLGVMQLPAVRIG